jgi:hypothetical protein
VNIRRRAFLAGTAGATAMVPLGISLEAVTPELIGSPPADGFLPSAHTHVCVDGPWDASALLTLTRRALARAARERE